LQSLSRRPLPGFASHGEASLSKPRGPVMDTAEVKEMVRGAASVPAADEAGFTKIRKPGV